MDKKRIEWQPTAGEGVLTAIVFWIGVFYQPVAILFIGLMVLEGALIIARNKHG